MSPGEPPDHALGNAVLERLVHYGYFLSERLAQNPDATFTSTEIAALLDVDDTLARKDLAAMGVRGLPRVGFKAEDALAAIRKLLGFDSPARAVIIGIGRLGSALAAYPGFTGCGLEIAGLFDNDPAKVGVAVGALTVLPLERLPGVVSERDVGIAVLTVPREAAHDVADLAVSAGIKAIWNFTDVSISVPHTVFVRHEHLAVGLAELGYHLRRLHPANPSREPERPPKDA